MINHVVLVGRLTRDPELKYTTNGIANLRFSVAVNRTFTNQNGERQADFINCVAWRGQAENMAKFLRKGSLIGTEGRIETGSYQAQDGSTRYTTDVIVDNVQFLEPKGTNNAGVDQYADASKGYYPDNVPHVQPTPGSGYNQHTRVADRNAAFNTANPFNQNTPGVNINDDDLPF